MKILRKINKGLILTIIVLLVLIIYLVNLEVKRNAEKPKIEQVCNEYIELMNKYASMPKDYQKLYDITKIQNNDEVEQIKKNVNTAISRRNAKVRKGIEDKND